MLTKQRRRTVDASLPMGEESECECEWRSEATIHEWRPFTLAYLSFAKLDGKAWCAYGL